MAIVLYVIYPVVDGVEFDHDYYSSTHLALVREHWGPHMAAHSIDKGLAGMGGAPAPFHAIFTAEFADQAGLEGAIAQGGPILADIPNYYGAQPQVLVSERVA